MKKNKKKSRSKPAAKRGKTPARVAREAVAPPKKVSGKVPAAPGGAKKAENGAPPVSKQTKATLQSQLKAGLEVEDELLLGLAAKMRENLRLEILIEQEQGK